MTDLKPTIDELIEREGSQAHEVAERLVSSYYPAVFRLASSMLPDAQEADDAAQEAILQALNKLDQYQTGTNFNAWLYTIALNTCRDRLRGHKRRGKLREALHRLRPSSDNRRPAENAALRRESNDDLWRAVGELEEKHRVTVILRTAHDLSVSEIARIMEVPKKTVYSRLYAAFRELRGRLQRAKFLEP